jgi:endoglucanase
VPPPRKVFSLADPVAYAATSLPDAALAIIAKYGACKWELADGYTDYLLGTPAAAGQVVRAVSDSGYGSSPGNAMEMINWINKDSGATGPMSLPVMRVTNGRKNSDHAVPESFGFWCKKSGRMAGVQPNPRNRVPYNLEDAHFAVAALSVPAQNNTGVVFQASKTEDLQTSELGFTNGQPRAKWVDSKGQTVQLLAPAKLAANTPAVLALVSVAGAQKLRLNSAEVGSSAATFAPSAFTQMLMGCGYVSYYPREGFRGNLYAVIAGKGAPTLAELAVLEQYLAGTAGLALK